MIQFEMIEIVTGVIAMITFLPSLLIYPGAIIYRQNYALLRDIKPLYCVLNHVAAIVFVTHLMLGWKHEDQLRILLEVFQLFGNIFFFGFYVCKHYVLCRRYDTDGATPLPPYVVFTLASGPFVLVSTYRLASNFSAHCYSDLATGVVALIELALVRIKFLVEYHPSPHFKNASRLESVTIFVAATICVIHQWVDEDPAMVTMIIILALLVNASFIGYIFPPLWTKFRRRDEYTVQSEFNRGEAKRGLLDGVGSGGAGGAKRYGGAGNSLLNSPLNVETGGIGIVQEKASSNVVVGTESENWFARLACKFIKPKKKQEEGSSARESEDRFGASPYKSLDTFPGQSGRNLPSHGLHDPDAHQKPASPELKQLLEIINDGDARRVQTFLAHTRLTVLNEGDGRGRTPLHHAVARGDINIIRFLLQMGSDRNQTDAHGYAALHDAVRQSPGQRGAAKSTFYDVSNVICELLDGTGGQMGAMVNLATSGGFTALHFTIMRDQLGALHTLLRYNADPLYNNDKEDPDQPWQESHTGSSLTFDTCKRSPLMLAVELGLEKHVSSLLRHVQQKRLEIRCPHKLTLLHVALSLGHSKVVEVLLREARSNPMTIHEVSKMTCMHFAALGGSCEAMCHMIDALNLPDILPTELRKDTHNPGGSAAYGNSSASNRYSPVGSTPKSFRSSRSMSVGLFPKSASFEPSGRSERGILSGTGLVYPTSSNSGGTGSVSSPNTLAGNLVCNNQQRVMTYGEALGLLQRHIPGFIADSERLMAIEGKVDAAVAEARARGQVEEGNKLQQAMMILNRRCKSCGPGSSRENLFFSSSQAAQYTPEGSSINPNAPQRAIDLVSQADSQGMTPMHYAIRQGHLKMITILAATIAAGDPEDETLDSQPSTTTIIPVRSGDATSSSGRGDGSSQVFILDARHKSESDQLISPTNLTESGSHTTIVSPQRANNDDLFGSEDFGAYGTANIGNNSGNNSKNKLLESSGNSNGNKQDLVSQFSAFARDEHGHVDAQEIMEAIEQGQEIARQYLKVEETRPKSSPQGTGARNTPVPQGAGTPRDSVISQAAAVLGRPPIAPLSQARCESSLTSYPSGSFDNQRGLNAGRKPSNSPSGGGHRSPGDLSHMKFTCEKKTSSVKLRSSTPPNGPLGPGSRRSPSVSPIGSSQPIGGDSPSSAVGALPAGLPPLPTRLAEKVEAGGGEDPERSRGRGEKEEASSDEAPVQVGVEEVPEVEVEGEAPSASARTLAPPTELDSAEITPPLSAKSEGEQLRVEEEEEEAASPVKREKTEEGSEA